MTSILAVDDADLTATVQAGVVNADLGRAAAGERLWYSPDPASWEFSTIGGNVATNAGGLCCVKYGVTRDSLLAARGRARPTAEPSGIGRRTRKGVAGLRPRRAAVRLRGDAGDRHRGDRPAAPAAGAGGDARGELPGARAAPATRSPRIAREQRPSLLELMDRQTIRAVEAFEPQELDTDAAAMVFARADDGPRGVARRGRGDGADLRGVRRRPRRHERRGGRGPDADGGAAARLHRARAPRRDAARRRRGPARRDPRAVRRRHPDRRRVRRPDLHVRPRRRRQHAPDGRLRRDRPGRGGAARGRRSRRSSRSRSRSAARSRASTGSGCSSGRTWRGSSGDAHDLHRAIKAALDPAGVFNPGKAV